MLYFAFNSYIPYLNSLVQIVKIDHLGLSQFCQLTTVGKVLNFSVLQLSQFQMRVKSL